MSEVIEAVEKTVNKAKDSINAEFEKKLATLDKDIRELIDKGNGQTTDAKKIAEDVKTQLDNATKQWQEVKEAQQKHLDALDLKLQKAGKYGSGEKGENFETLLNKGITENIDKLRAKKLGELASMDFNVSMDSKAVADMAYGTHTTVASAAARFVPPTMVPGMFYDPLQQPSVRQLVGAGVTSSPFIRYVRYVGKEGGPAMVAEGGLKPKIDFDLDIKDANVKKIAVHVRISEEMLEDIPYMSSFITNMSTQELKIYEETQILTGDGTGNNLEGIVTAATDFAAGDLTGKVPLGYASRIDVIRAAINQVRLKRYNPNAILLHPTDLTLMRMEKEGIDGSKRTLVPSTLDNPIPSIDGIQIVTNAALDLDDFIVGDFRSGSQLFDRQQVNVRFYDQDQDNAVKNLITVVVEERLVLITPRPNAYSYGDFTTATAAIEADA